METLIERLTLNPNDMDECRKLLKSCCGINTLEKDITLDIITSLDEFQRVTTYIHFIKFD